MRGFSILALTGAALLSGCATSGGGGGLSESGCQSIKAQLNRLDARGVRSSVEAQAAGRKLSPAQKADADAYNKALSDYLGNRCHEAKT
jgi:hypothetical protein